MREKEQAARALPGARPDRLALVGHSRGGGEALQYVPFAQKLGELFVVKGCLRAYLLGARTEVSAGVPPP